MKNVHEKSDGWCNEMFPNECLVAREQDMFVIFHSNGTTFFITLHFIFIF